MRTIYKYPLAIEDLQFIDLPTGAEILTVQTQRDVPQIWVLCDPSKPTTARPVVIYGTGCPVPDGTGRYVGSFQTHGGDGVWHVFEVARF